jgi:hypothetical protein
MGSSYGNVTLRGPTQAQVVERLKDSGIVAYVSPTRDGVTVVYDCRGDRDPSALRAVTLWLSREMRCAAWGTLVHDSDVLIHHLARDGEMRDEYDSFPGFPNAGFQRPAGGDAAVLCREMGLRACDPAAVEAALRRTGHTFEEARHGELLEALGHPDLAFGTGYTYVWQEEYPDGVTREMLAHVGEEDGDCDAPYPFERAMGGGGRPAGGGGSGLRDAILWLLLLAGAVSAWVWAARSQKDVSRRDAVKAIGALLAGAGAADRLAPRD